MNLYHLKYFCDAVELGSIAKSAQANNITPGAVSQAIIKLEDHFKQNLVLHKKKSFNVTSLGLELYNSSIPLLSDFQHLYNKISEGESMDGEFKFITQQSIAESILSPFLKKFKTKYSKTLPKMILGNTLINKDKLKNKSVDFAITLNNTNYDQVNSESIYKGNFVLYQSKKYKHNPLEFLITAETPEVRNFKNNYRMRFKSSPLVAHEVSSWGLLKRMADEGNGVALIPDYLLTNKEKKNILNLNINLSSYEILILHPNSRPLSLKSSIFISELKEFLLN